MVQGPGYQHILTTLFQGQDASRAITHTLERGSNAYSFYKYCRQRILRDNTHRDPLYLQRVREFQHVHYSPQDPEWEKLNSLMEGSLRDQYRVETSRKPFLPNRELDKALREINCLPPVFYEYRMPQEVVDEACEREELRRERKHRSSVEVSDVQMILCKAREWRERTNPWELVACALILCGRRVQEIIWSMDWIKESDYIIQVRGLLKQQKGEGRIPLLIPFHEWAELMTRIREAQLPRTSTTHRLKPAFVRVFGKWYTHAERRNIYCELGYRLRDTNSYERDMSKIMWFDSALCHDDNVIRQAANLTYQSLHFRDE